MWITGKLAKDGSIISVNTAFIRHFYECQTRLHPDDNILVTRMVCSDNDSSFFDFIGTHHEQIAEGLQARRDYIDLREYESAKPRKV
jgi:hypothetical protein